MVDKAQLDAAEQQVSALQAEVSRLKRDVVEARKAAPAASGDEALKREIAELREEVVTAHQLVEAKLAEIEQITHDLVAARAELADRARAAESRTADMQALQQQLAEAVQRAEQNAAEAGRVPALEDRITAMQEQFNAKDNEVAELQEKLDTEAARSYRLSQRRIPALNKEIEDAQENAREMERKLQKAELRSQTLDDQATELRARVADLESALAGAKARAQDTQIVAPADMDSRAVAEDELRRAASRLREVEAERSQLAESLRRIGDAHGLELGRHSTRADKLEKDAEQRLQELLGQRAALRNMRERVQNMLHVAEDLASARDSQRKVLIDALRKLAELPPEK
jgi:chromosome segregation ATPase